MIVQEFTIDRYDWLVRVFYLIDTFPLEEITDALKELGCEEEEAYETAESLELEGYNVGATYSNIYKRESLIIIGKAVDAQEFYDTFDHEKGHLAMHICIADSIDPFSEKFQYLSGEIAGSMFRAAKELLCEECRKKLVN
jgi:hypothetical protein